MHNQTWHARGRLAALLSNHVSPCLHLHKGDRMRRPPADDAGRLAGSVAQAPVVIVRDGLLQDALQGYLLRSAPLT